MRGGRRVSSGHGPRGRHDGGGSLHFEGLRHEILRAEAVMPSVSLSGGGARVVVLYPGSYEEGMASLSVHVLAEIFARAGCWVERAFYFPGFSGPVRTLETGTPLGDCDVVLATVPFELQLPVLVEMLGRSGIPPVADDRGGEHPVVICGGPAPSANPLPWSAVADFIYVGELEARSGQLIEAVGAAAAGRPAALAEVPGVVDCARLRCGELDGPVAHQTAADVDAYVPRSVWVAPRGPFGHRALIEVARGCPGACRFCLARRVYWPARPRSFDVLAGAIRLVTTIAPAVGFIAPSFADHPRAVELVRRAAAEGLAVSVPSLRADAVVRRPELLETLRAAGQQSLTLAPEAATERLRRHIGKPLTDAQLLEAVDAAAELGFSSLKLYFMIGLPSEAEEDVAAFAELFSAIAAAGKAMSISASVACFVPKARTAFEAEEMLPVRELQRRLRAVEAAARRVGIQLAAESPRLAWAQAAVARGDVDLGLAIASLPVLEASPVELVAAARRAGAPADHYARRGAENAPWNEVVCGPHSLPRAMS